MRYSSLKRTASNILRGTVSYDFYAVIALHISDLIPVDT